MAGSPKDKRATPRMRKPPKTLTLKQERFVKAYIETGNGTESARIAGYRGNNATLQSVATENLRKPLIVAALNRGMQTGAESIAVTASSVLADIDGIQRVALEKGQLSTALRAAELKGKTLAMFSSRIEVVPGVEEVTDGELHALLFELMERADDDTKQNLAGVLAGDAGPIGDLPGPTGDEAPE